jgi:apolipoprotein D and lipocalin family protein
LIRALPLLLLAACAAAPSGYRAGDAAISSMAVLDPAQLSGEWVEVAGFFAPGQGCALGDLRLSLRADGGLNAELAGCPGGSAAGIAGPRRADRVAPGRIAVAGLADPLWLLWVDGDYRTMVVGTPSGRIGAVLNRPGGVGADRLAAAREILDWNGYDLSRMREVRP